jgi:ABC-type nitrate/sulfonate/bicarbonate transport system substrate-binding protein
MTAIALLLAIASAAPASPALTVAYHRNENAAPLYAACLYSNDFQTRYNLWLAPAEPRGIRLMRPLRPIAPTSHFTLYDNGDLTLDLALVGMDSDSAVLTALLAGKAQVGILAAEEVLTSVLAGGDVRVIAPLQYRGDMLLVRKGLPASNWPGFIAWTKKQTTPVSVGYVGDRSMTVLGFEQALQYENVRFSHDQADTSARVLLVPCHRSPVPGPWSLVPNLDAAVLFEPAATLCRHGGVRAISRTDFLPPNRFEDRPGFVIAATDASIKDDSTAISRFLELMGVATHYVNNHTGNTLAATARWLKEPAGLEKSILTNVMFSSLPDASFKNGLWNWYFALRLKGAVPESLANYMERDQWLGVPYDSSLVIPALDRAGARIIR